MLRTLVLLFTLCSVASVSAQDTAALERVLVATVHGGRVDYAAFGRDPTLRADLDRYVASLATMPDGAGLADWLNAYNGLVVSSVVAHYPIRSVREVPGFFDRQRHRVAGSERTLDAIENQVIRPRFHDARVHVALVCGAVGCPSLPSHVFRASSLDATLTRLARAVVASERYVRTRGGQLALSEIFFWFREDFERDAGSVLAWLRRYDERGRLAAFPADVTPLRIPYAWSLNDATR